MVDLVDGSAYQMKLRYRGDAAPVEDGEQNRRNLLSALDQLVTGAETQFWSLFDPHVTFHEAECLPYGGSFHGLEATRQAHAKIYDYFDSMHVEVEQIVAAGDIAMAYVQLKVRVRKSGRTGSFPLAELYRFRNGKIIEWRALYFDASKIAALLAAE